MFRPRTFHELASAMQSGATVIVGGLDGRIVNLRPANNGGVLSHREFVVTLEAKDGEERDVLLSEGA